MNKMEHDQEHPREPGSASVDPEIKLELLANGDFVENQFLYNSLKEALQKLATITVDSIDSLPLKRSIVEHWNGPTFQSPIFGLRWDEGMTGALFFQGEIFSFDVREISRIEFLYLKPAKGAGGFHLTLKASSGTMYLDLTYLMNRRRPRNPTDGTALPYAVTFSHLADFFDWRFRLDCASDV
ncbi:MAG: hypothetical protein QM599_11620 [Pseudoxanthomonas sp.]